MPAARKTIKRKTATKKKTTARKSTTRKTTARKSTTRKTTAKRSNVTHISAAKRTAVKEVFSKTEQIAEIADMTELSKKEVKAVFEAQELLIERSIKKGSVGQITLPLGLKIEVKVKPARKARKGINPFTGEEMMFKAKPASRVVKIKALKKIKDYAV